MKQQQLEAPAVVVGDAGVGAAATAAGTSVADAVVASAAEEGPSVAISSLSEPIPTPSPAPTPLTRSLRGDGDTYYADESAKKATPAQAKKKTAQESTAWSDRVPVLAIGAIVGVAVLVGVKKLYDIYRRGGK